MTDTRTLEQVITPALDAYGEALAEHGHTGYSHGETSRCVCGWAPRESMQTKSKRRAVGIHIAAAEKKAEKAYSAQVDTLLAEARKGGWR